MPRIDTDFKFDFLSELYAGDAPGACLLAEYPSSNSPETVLQNRSQFIIHDPFPPPPRSLIKVLGPHHLMCGWGNQVAVSSEIGPSAPLLNHWRRSFGEDGCPDWRPFDGQANYITLFPHESIPKNQQVVDPEINYALHSKEVIGKIDCPQAKVLDEICPPCVVKLSHGYAGLSNFFVHSAAEEAAVREQIRSRWPEAKLVINEILEDLNGDFGVQFYLRRDGSMVWLGFTEQHFDKNKRWSGGSFSDRLQLEMFGKFAEFIKPAGRYLHDRGYFGVVGIDILRNTSGQFFLVDVNPRLTGISPFLMASRIFAREGFSEGIYQASCAFNGSLEQLISVAEKVQDARVMVLSAVEDASSGTTRCHLSASSRAQETSRRILAEMTAS